MIGSRTRLHNSLTPRWRMFLTPMAQVSCFFKNAALKPNQHGDGNQEGDERLMQPGKAQRFVEGPAGDRDVIGRGINGPDQVTKAFQGGNRVG